MKLLLDTSVLIDVLRSRKQRRETLAALVRAGHSLATSSLNIAEVYAGMRLHEESSTANFLNSLECHELTAAAGRRAGKFVSHWRQKGRTLELPDAIVASIAIENDCWLVTDNRKDFPMPEVRLYSL